MKEKEKTPKENYSEPKVLASYKKDELEEIIKPHGQATPETGGGGGCGCGGGMITTNTD